jgi:competence protein ComEC
VSVRTAQRTAGYAALVGVCAALAGPAAADGAAAGVLATVCAVLVPLWLGAGLLLPVLRRRAVWGLALCALFGAGAAAAHLWDQHARRWPAHLDGERVIAVLRIESLPELQGGTIEFDALADIEAPQALRRSLRLRVSWRGAPRPLPRVGERWRLLMRVDHLVGARNPGGFDPAPEALRGRIHGRAVVVKAALNARLAPAPPSLDVLRERIARAIRATVEDRDAAALFAGLAVGATGAMTREQWRVFSVTGTTHLVAISGMHVTLFAWLAAGLARRLWRVLAAWRAPPIAREPWAASVGIGAALGYALLAGFGIPTQRTVVMLAVWWAMRLSGRERSTVEVLGAALLAVLVIDPLAPLSSGFWLSFTAMGVLLLGDLEHAAPRRSALQELAWTQARVGVALAPLTLAWFSSVSLAGFIVNFVAIPVISFVLVPLVLLGMLWAPAWRIAERVHDIGWPLLQAAADWPGAALTLHADPWWIALAALTVPLWLLPVPSVWRAAGLCAFLPWALVVAGVLPRADAPAQGEARIVVLDAGDGAAVLVRTRRHALLVDTATTYLGQAAGTRSRVLPLLRESGLRRLDLLVSSSAEGGRAAGAAEILAVVEVVAGRFGGAWPDAPAPFMPCAHAERWSWDGIEVELRPARPPEGSCVLRIGPPSGPHLLIAERLDAQEGAALLASAAPLRADLALAPRRGSLVALAPGFTAAVGARWLLISAREVPARRRSAIAAAWHLPTERVHATAREGALAVELRAGLPPRVLRYRSGLTDGWGPVDASPGPPPLGYHPRAR